MKFIFSISLFLISIACFAQEDRKIESDTLKITIDPNKQKINKEKIERDFKPSAVNIGLDVLGLARTATSKGYSKFEAQADIDLDRYFFVIDLGHEESALSNGDFSSANSGNYFRAGVQVNMMPYNPNRNFFFVVLRYARSYFSDNIIYKNNFDKWGEKQLSFENEGLSARWLEMTMGMKVKVFERLYFGYTIRYKMAKKISSFEELIPGNIPGFGAADKSSNFGFNYYILYHIPFRDKPVPKKPKKTPRERSEPLNNSSGFGDSFQRPF